MKTIILAMFVVIPPHARAAISRAFRPDEFQILWTTNPSEAVEASARYHPDLLLLDLNQPLHKGWRTYEELRTANPDAPTVVLADHESIYDQAVANRKGAVLQKPVEGEILLQTAKVLMKEPSPAGVLKKRPDVEFRETSITSDPLHVDLLKRYTASHQPSPAYHHWGINE